MPWRPGAVFSAPGLGREIFTPKNDRAIKPIIWDVANELWTAREILSKPGARTDLDKNLSRFTWSGYCEEVGITYISANNWLSKWFPEQLDLPGKPRESI